MLLSLLVVGPFGFATMGQHASPGHDSSDLSHGLPEVSSDGDYIGCICGYGPLYISMDGALFHSAPAVDPQVGDSVKYTPTPQPDKYGHVATYTVKITSIDLAPVAENFDPQVGDIVKYRNLYMTTVNNPQGTE